MTIEYSVTCDGCGHIIVASSISKTAVRREFRTMGGLTSIPVGRDYCKDCVRLGRHEQGAT